MRETAETVGISGHLKRTVNNRSRHIEESPPAIVSRTPLLASFPVTGSAIGHRARYLLIHFNNIDQVADRISELPSVSSRPTQGDWIYQGNACAEWNRADFILIPTFAKTGKRGCF